MLWSLDIDFPLECFLELSALVKLLSLGFPQPDVVGYLGRSPLIKEGVCMLDSEFVPQFCRFELPGFDWYGLCTAWYGLARFSNSFQSKSKTSKRWWVGPTQGRWVKNPA